MAENNGLRFLNKVAIVTGGASGIGEGCVEILAENGGQVVVLDIQDDLGKKMSCKGPGQISYMHCDVRNEQEIKNCVEKTVAQFGKLDCVVNNVGVHPGDTTVADQTVDDFRRLLEVNLVSHYAMYRYTLPHLRKSKGSVVNIGSVSGEHGQLTMPTYSATKGAIPALARSIAVDEAPNGVRINTIIPGAINTPLMRAVVGDVTKSSIASWAQMGRVGEPRELGKACLFLAVDATFTTGETLHCSGGIELGFAPKTPELAKLKM